MENETTLVEVTELVTAVKKLNELSSRMRTKLVGFSGADIAHIDGIIDALHDLDLQKTRAMDTLETETIKCAAVRHRLIYYPEEINREIHEAVQLARIANDEAIGRIKTQLEALSIEIGQLDRQADGVDADNESMRSDLAAMKEEFDRHFARLNDLLGEKSAEQISLNEDREFVRWANSRMVELREDEAALADQMATEKEAHSNTMLRLQEETKLVAQQLRESKEKESKTDQESFVVHLAYEQLASELEDAIKLHKNLLHEIVTLQVQEQDLGGLLAQQRRRNEQQKSNIKTLAAQSKLAVEEHQIQIVELKNIAKELDFKSQEQTALMEQFVAKKSEVKVRTETLEVNEGLYAKKSEDTNNALQQVKQTLVVKTDELDRLLQEIFDIEGRRKELEDASRAEKEGWLNPSELLERNSVLEYNKQIAELKENLERQQAERMSIQASYDKVQATIRQFHADEFAKAREVTEQIDSLKQEKIALDDEERDLRARTKADEERRTGLVEQLTAGRRQLAETRRAKKAEADGLVSDTGRLAKEKLAKAAELAELTPKFDELRDFYDSCVAEYDALKRSVATLKSRRAGLEQSSRRTGEDIGRLAEEIAGLRRDKERRTAQSAGQLDEMAEERVRVESDIYVLGCKLATVQAENARLDAGIDRLEREMRDMRDTWEAAVPAKARIDQQRAREARDFQAGHLRDTAAEAEFRTDAERLLAALSGIFSDTEARRVVLKAVTDGLDKELGHLDEYLKTSGDQTE